MYSSDCHFSVTDGNHTTESGWLQVSINDVNDHSPVFTDGSADVTYDLMQSTPGINVKVKSLFNHRLRVEISWNRKCALVPCLIAVIILTKCNV